MEMFQHDGGVKSLTIKQQRDGTESVIWNLARFLLSIKKYLIWRTLGRAKQISHIFENVQLGQLQQRRMVDRANNGFGNLGQFFSRPLLWACWHQLLDVWLWASSVSFLFKPNIFLISASNQKLGFHCIDIRMSSIVLFRQMEVTLFQVILIAERGEAELGFAAIDSLTFKDLSEEPCETFPPQVM